MSLTSPSATSLNSVASANEWCSYVTTHRSSTLRRPTASRGRCFGVADALFGRRNVDHDDVRRVVGQQGGHVAGMDGRGPARNEFPNPLFVSHDSSRVGIRRAVAG